MYKLFFTFKGIINRKEFFFTSIGISLIASLISYIFVFISISEFSFSDFVNTLILIPFSISFILVIWITLAIWVKRGKVFKLHPSISIIISLIPIIQTIALIYFSIAKGKNTNPDLEKNIYDKIAKEFKDDKDSILSSGLWMKAIKEAGGQESKAKAIFIKLRYQEILDDSNLTQNKFDKDFVEDTESAFDKFINNSEKLKQYLLNLIVVSGVIVVIAFNIDVDYSLEDLQDTPFSFISVYYPLGFFNTLFNQTFMGSWEDCSRIGCYYTFSVKSFNFAYVLYDIACILFYIFLILLIRFFIIRNKIT